MLTTRLLGTLLLGSTLAAGCSDDGAQTALGKAEEARREAEERVSAAESSLSDVDDALEDVRKDLEEQREIEATLRSELDAARDRIAELEAQLAEERRRSGAAAEPALPSPSGDAPAADPEP